MSAPDFNEKSNPSYSFKKLCSNKYVVKMGNDEVEIQKTDKTKR